MSVEGNSIINSDGSNTVDKCNKVLNGSLEDPSHDLSYNEHILKDDNLKFLCSSSEINIKDLKHSFYNHDMSSFYCDISLKMKSTNKNLSNS